MWVFLKGLVFGDPIIPHLGVRALGASQPLLPEPLLPQQSLERVLRSQNQNPNDSSYRVASILADKNSSIYRMDIFPNTTPKGMFINKKIYMITVFFVVLGGLNWLLMGAMGINVVRLVLNRRMSSILYIVVGACALMLAFRRDVYLPFLGQTVLPAGALALKTPQSANESVEITTRPRAKVVYWASEPTVTADPKKAPGWDIAYDEFENSGVVVADDQGKAILRIRGPPQAYTVPLHGKLSPHIHFRIEEHGGFFGRVQTYYMDSKKIEGFADNV
jgi:uncharacterized membrane protein YuzA (DUF378 family)